MPPDTLLRVGTEAFEEYGLRMCGRCPHGLQKLAELPLYRSDYHQDEGSRRGVQAGTPGRFLSRKEHPSLN